MEQWTQLKSVNAIIQGYEVSTLTVFYDVKLHYEQEDTRTGQSSMETVTLIMPLEATTVNNPSDFRSDSGVTAGVTLQQQHEGW